MSRDTQSSPLVEGRGRDGGGEKGGGLKVGKKKWPLKQLAVEKDNQEGEERDTRVLS